MSQTKTDYTPTTETVRDFYQFGRHENGDRQGQGAREAEFDRWLTAHDAQIRAEVIDWIHANVDRSTEVSIHARQHFGLVQ